MPWWLGREGKDDGKQNTLGPLAIPVGRWDQLEVEGLSWQPESTTRL
jgi:hypothetical protein